MTASRKNLRVCQVYYDSQYYDVIIGIDTLDDVNDILNQWAEQEFGVLSGGQTVISPAFNLPEALVYAKNITDVITTLDIDNYVYVTSGVTLPTA